MNTHDIKLPPLPPGYKSYEFPDGGYDGDEMQAYTREAIEPYQKRIAELEAELQELHRQWVEHDTLGCPTAKTGIYSSEADRKRRGEPDYYTYIINGWYRGISNAAPPDDSYDEGTLQALYTAPQPAEPADMSNRTIVDLTKETA